MLFYGPPGTGKTSTILAVCRQLFSAPGLFSERVLELNASDERGISVVREKIKTFARGATAGTSDASGSKCPPWKVIILDEADSMTHDAQSALRRTMETFSKVTRFCLVCNYVSRIIEPLASRCAKFRFKPLEGDVMRRRLEHVCREERVLGQKTTLMSSDEKGVKSNAALDDVLTAVMRVSNGDLRRAITLLQGAHTFYGSELKPEHVIELAGMVPQERVEHVWSVLRSASFQQLEAAVDEFLMEGYSAQQMIDQLMQRLLGDASVNDVQKGQVLLKIAAADKNLTDGCDEYLQLLNVTCAMMETFCVAK